MSNFSTVTPPAPADLPQEPQVEPQQAKPAERDSGTGRFTSGNAVARTHGLYAQRIDPALVAWRDAFLAQSIADDGGESEVPARRRSLHEYRAQAHVHIVQLSSALDTHGVFDKRGKLRERWLKMLDRWIGRAQSLDNTLGLERQQKPVNPMDAVRAAVVEANNK